MTALPLPNTGRDSPALITASGVLRIIEEIYSLKQEHLFNITSSYDSNLLGDTRTDYRNASFTAPRGVANPPPPSPPLGSGKK